MSANWIMLPEGHHVPRATAQQPNYDAASRSQRLRAWRVPVSGPNTSVVHDLPIIRGRARAAVRNDPWAGAALDKDDANAIGTGITAKMVNGTDDEKRTVKRLWNRWCEESDADGVLNFYAQQYLAWHEWREVGEVFVRERPRRLDDGLAVPLQWQIIESEQVPTDLNTVASNGNRIRAGIELNGIGRRVAYWMYREHPGDFAYLGSQELVRVPADQVIHLYRPMRAGQLRGIPDHVSVLLKMFNLEHLDDNVLERQKIANLFMGFYEKQIDPESGVSLVDEMTDLDGDGEPDETGDDDVPLAGMEPATMQELPPGWRANFTEPPTPGSEYAEFLRGHLLAIAARHGVPYEVLTGDLRNVSDRALKLILNEFRRSIEMRQWLFFIPTFCQRVRNRWFDTAIVSGALELASYSERREELLETLWVPQGWPYSHPVQDVTADIKAIRAGLDSRSAAILRRGEDPEQVDEEIAEDNARADSLDLVLDSDPRRTSGGSGGGASSSASSPDPTDGDRGNDDER